MDQKTKHTPGPWTLERDRAKSLSLYSGPIFIGEIYHEVDEPSTQEQANAPLIASAPAMYAALSVALNMIRRLHRGNIMNTTEQDRQDIATIKTALAQAEGVGHE